MTDGNDDESGVNDETVIRNPNEDEESGDGPTVPTGSNDAQEQNQSGGQGGPSVPGSGDGQSGGQGGPSVPGSGDGQSGGQPDGRTPQSSDGQAGPSVPGSGQAQPTTGQSGGGQAQPTTGQSGGGQTRSAGGATATTTGGTAAGSGGSGLDPNVAGAVAYLFAPLGGIAMYVIDDDEFVQFHAKQGIVFGVLLLAAWVGLFLFNFVVGFVFDAIGVGALDLLWGLVSFLLYLGLVLVGFVAWAFLTYKAYQGDRFQIPLVGGMVA